MNFKKVKFLLLCLTLSVVSFCQPDKYPFSHIDYSNGLSNNHINCIYQDDKGFMWFGTHSGLNKYDGYNIKHYSHNDQDSSSLTDDYIEQLFEAPDGKLWAMTRERQLNIYNSAKDGFESDYQVYLKQWKLPYNAFLATIVKSKNDFWFLYPDLGIFRYMENGDVIPIIHTPNDTTSIDASKIIDLKKNVQGDIWVIHDNGILEKIESLHNRVIYRTNLLQKELGTSYIDYNLFVDCQDELWVYSGGLFNGAYYINPKKREIRHLSQNSKDWRITNNYIYNIAQDGRGLIWIATDHGGINIIDKEKHSIKKLLHDEADNKSLPENSIVTLFKDKLNIMWLGSNKSGVSYYHENVIKFPQYKHQPFNPNSLSNDDINSFAEDKEGLIWIGSNGGGLISFDRKTNKFQQYLHDPENPSSLCSDVITSLLVDRQNKLWIGTYFGGLDCYDGNKFTHYKHDDTVPGSLADDRAMFLFEDSDGKLWIAVFNAGLDQYDPQKKLFLHYPSDQSNFVSNAFVTCMVEDAEKNLWVGTGYGISMFEKKTGKSLHYSRDENSLSNNSVTCLLTDKSGNIWAGTRDGLNLFDKGKNRFQSFKKQDGLSDNFIRCLLEDNFKNVWASTSDGISKIKLLENKSQEWQIIFKNYDEQDGLQGREFNERAGLKLKSGELAIGGPNGFNIFDPASIPYDTITPNILFTDLKLFNSSVRPGAKIDGRIILSQSISDTKEITLDYNQNVFSIEFAALTYTNVTKNKYFYMLRGFNKTWLAADPGIRAATYTNLDPGEYVFEVKATNADGALNEEAITLKITILPPFWKTPAAYLTYILLIVGTFYLSRRIGLKRVKMRFVLERERREAKRIHEMDAMKIRFFTNMSHELRTPLSLILSPIEKLLGSQAPLSTKNQYELIQRNAKRLLNLVNQLLDFRKLEANELKLNTTDGDIIKFIENTTKSFTDLAATKNITFERHCVPQSFHTKFDHDKIERILFNLLSNAFKFTPENGHVAVHVTLAGRQTGMTSLQIKVCDNGIGIAADTQDQIFERFFQSPTPNSILNQGSGIGLAITKEFVKMHDGSISVQSEPDKGSCFTIVIPVQELVENTGRNEIVENPDDIEKALIPLEHQGEALYAVDEQVTKTNKKKTLLIVEDNDDFRFYVKDNLNNLYNVIEAADGREGWQKALAVHPDLIVSDISMPIMDGIELCKKIKNDTRTNQIPVILLTAVMGEGQELKGLETGASDYLTKPFNFEILLSKVRNLLEYKDTIKKTYQKQVQVTQPAMEIELEGGKLLKTILGIIEKNIDNPDFSVEELSRELHLSRATLYKKLLAITGKSPIEFIRHIRLIRAAELLEKTHMTISEIAYNVGFNSPKYFTQYFKAEFDAVPTAYRTQKREKED